MEAMRHRLAYVVRGLDAVGARAMVDAVVVDPVDAVIVALGMAALGEDVHIVAPTLEARRQLGDVHAETAGDSGVQGFRREHRDAHALAPRSG